MMNDVTQYAGLTTVGPVARIIKIDVDGHAHIWIEPADFGKLKEGDMIEIVQMNNDQGQGLYNNKTFQIAHAHEDDFQFTLLEDGAEIESESTYAPTGGFAKVVGWQEVPKAPVRKSQAKPAPAPAHVKTPLSKTAKKDDDDE